MRRVGCDLDGVIFDFTTPFGAFLFRRYDIVTCGWPHYNIAKYDPPGERGITWTAFHEFCRIGGFRAMEAEDLDGVWDRDLLDLSFITARSMQLKEDTERALERGGLGIAPLYFVKSTPGRSKSDLCDMIEADVMIEDSPLEAEELLANGKTVYLVKRSYNAAYANTTKHRSLHVVKSVQDAIRMLQGEDVEGPSISDIRNMDRDPPSHPGLPHGLHPEQSIARPEARRTPSSADLRRIATGATALQELVREHPDMDKIADGVRALQSTEDLGHDQINALVWNAMILLQIKMRDAK